MKDNFKWPVMHLCERQLRDVNESDILNGGLYRRCNTYKGGGGYDKFPDIFVRRTGKDGALNEQFVVQLKGCPLRCPYCYVTLDGVHTGKMSEVETDKLIEDFHASKLPVFHLMGGAPALYIDHWKKILERLDEKIVFHSDLLLLEGYYKEDTIRRLAKYKNALSAVSIKGSTDEEFKKNTGVNFNEDMFWKNLDMIVDNNLPVYLTFTGMEADSVNRFKEKVIRRYKSDDILKDSFAIGLVEYNALK